MIRAERRALLRADASALREPDREEFVLVDALIGCPLSGANRNTFAHFEVYRF
jgi:hypothetical protein